ncbi:thioredoxin [Marinibactrum halimedae]|uniref:Thioredoxin n=1 Tax=Marinibactrum halimedae TaxID=1444977 RepID=A0AA37TFH8_9GAMM|nr:thioredoxin [Marinibactrum halimedae]MCD9459513.1 thioredoxin [Marinibactrum halimedae]GLS28167.1 hypothetical protein GCM10007877_38860 [Marinibactrum halimedae]
MTEECIVDIDQNNAQAQLIDESFKRPVMIDFWAEWCGPCKSLMPLLESLANEYAGQFLLAKVNADDQQMIAAQFGVRSLPTVMIMKEGQPVDGFAGAQTEAAIREILDKYLPKAWELALAEAQALLEEENFTEAMEKAQQAVSESSNNPQALKVLADTLVELNRLDDAQSYLDKITLVDQEEYFVQIQAKLNLRRESAKSPELSALEEEMRAQPDNLSLHLTAAVQYHDNGFTQEALELLIKVLRKDLDFNEGEAKKTFLDVIASLGKADPLAVKYQRQFYTLLY